jgi:hypothetical protein
MLADREFLESVLAYVGERLKHEVNGMLIGGNAMLYYDLKGQTKDLDLVFFKKEDISGIVRIILSHPLYRKAKVLIKPSIEVKPELLKKGKPTVIGDTDLPRFDIFYRYVFSVDTEKIFEGSKRSIRFELLKLKLIDVENLIFLKAVSGRPVDVEDIVRVVKNLEIDWKNFVDFVKGYYKTDHKPVWFLLGTIYELNKKEEIIPKFVVREVEKLFEG